jgi:hypothetical protein
MENEENEKNECFYKCICCDFKCSYMSDWNRHVTTRKHLVSLRGNNLEMKLGEKNERIEIQQCQILMKYNFTLLLFILFLIELFLLFLIILYIRIL